MCDKVLNKSPDVLLKSVNGVYYQVEKYVHIYQVKKTEDVKEIAILPHT